jgi:hypothetical protein
MWLDVIESTDILKCHDYTMVRKRGSVQMHMLATTARRRIALVGLIA